ncbi:MAG: phosphate ABC transporter substrate-binding protein PstS [Bacteroidota bacterium]
MNRLMRLAAAALLVAAAGAGCSSKGGGGGSGARLTGAGATFPYPLYSKWFDTYREKSGVQINYQSIGSGGGIQQLKAGTVDFGASDAPLTDDKLRDMPHPVLHFPTVAGAVVLAYNLPGVKQQIQLSRDALVAIYTGHVRKWNDARIAAVNLGVKLPDLTILPVHRSDGSGTTNIFTTYLSAVSASWKDSIGANTSVSWPGGGVGAKGNDGVAGQVRQTPGAIGYVELAYAKQNALPMAKLQNAAGVYVDPTLASTTAAVRASAAALQQDVRTPIVNAASPDAYPIAGLTFLLVYESQPDAAKGKALAQFIQWAMTDGQKMAEPLYYAPLPEEIVRVNQANLSKVTSAGKPVLASR